MAFVIRKLPDEPIIIVTIDLPIERYMQNVRSLNAQVDHLASTLTPPIYRILDAHAIEPTISDILLWIAEQDRGRPGSLTDPRVRPIAVGISPIAEVAVRKVRQLVGIEVPWFTTLEEALAFARAEIAQPDTPDGDE
ncbi:MAG: hypothetical protein JXJ20_00975 [Anaerolineae bacterium]|nr:hypothetical protein [Anaerolineae bacterium]